MRFLFTVQPATGHLNPVLPTALRLQSLGHEVRVASSATFRHEIEDAGVAAIVAGRDWLESDSANTMPQLLTAQLPGQIRLFAELADEMTADILTQEFRPDLVVRETVEFGGALVAERLGVPCVVSGIGLRTPVPLLDHWAGDALRAALSNHAPDHGLELFDGHACLTHLPRSWVPDQMPAFDREHFFQPGSLDAGQGLLPEWLGQRDRSRPLIYASLGTVFNDAPHIFGELIRAALDQPFDLLLALGRKADPASFEHADNVHKERYVAQDAVLREVDAVLCHGGMGTVVGALRNGLPLCCVPFSADQPLNAIRTEQLGCGRAYTTYKPEGVPVAIARVEEVTSDALREHMNSLIEEPAYRLAAEQIAAEIAALPGVDDEVTFLVGLAEQHRSR
jgi:UDP:flavonoid glycosyltransferase YjiC (YdhE family)